MDNILVKDIYDYGIKYDSTIATLMLGAIYSDTKGLNIPFRNHPTQALHSYY